MTTETHAEFVMGWHAEAEATAERMGLAVKTTPMPGGYSDRLWVRGDASTLEAFKSLPQVRRGEGLSYFSPGKTMPRWVAIA